MDAAILTGASRGIGRALAVRLVSAGLRVICIAREADLELVSRYPGQLLFIEYDLKRTEGLEELAETVFRMVDLSKVKRLLWINNAGQCAPLSYAGSAAPEALADNIRVNLTAPMILTSLFIRHTEGFAADKRILNVTSSSSKFLYEGMAAYSASKAGLDVFTRCAALEQRHAANPVLIASVWPGMVDTDMQAEVRAAGLPAAKRLTEAYESGALASPGSVADKLAELLLGESFPSGHVLESL